MAKKVVWITSRYEAHIPRLLGNLLIGKGKRATEALRLAGKKAREIVQEASGHPAQPRKYLEAVGHPYARRDSKGKFSKIKTGKLLPPFKQKPYMIGKMSGEIQSSVHGDFFPAKGMYRIRIKPKSDRVKFVVEGTKILIGRDVVRESISEIESLKQIRDTFFKEFRRL